MLAWYCVRQALSLGQLVDSSEIKVVVDASDTEAVFVPPPITTHVDEPDIASPRTDEFVAPDVHNDELGTLYCFLFMVWRLCSMLLVNTKPSERVLQSVADLPPSSSKFAVSASVVC